MKNWTKRIVVKLLEDGKWDVKFRTSDPAVPFSVRDLRMVERAIRVGFRQYQRTLRLAMKGIGDTDD